MKMKYIVVLLVFGILILSSCAQQVPQKETCKSPYIEYKAGECCLDQNGNNICDSDEVEEVVVEEVAPSSTQSGQYEEPSRQIKDEEPDFGLYLSEIKYVSSGPAGMKGNIICADYNEKYEPSSIWININDNVQNTGLGKSDLSDVTGLTNCPAKSLLFYCEKGQCLQDKYSGTQKVTLNMVAIGEQGVDRYTKSINFDVIQ